MATSFVISSSPHLHTRSSTQHVMWLVNLALLPTIIASVIIFGWNSLAVIAVSIVAAVASEAFSQYILKRKITVADGSAVVTGILFAFTLPSTTPLWMTALGVFTAILVVKHLFGGLGYNIFNPALAGRAVLLASFPVAMTSWSEPVKWAVGKLDAVSTASPLGMVKEALQMGTAVDMHYTYLDMFLGNIPGSLGETCKVTLLAGFLFLLILRIVDWRIPVMYIGTVVLISLIMRRDPLFDLLAGGLFLGAFFMATDLVTSPATKPGKLIFGAGCGLITIFIRNVGGFPEGVCYSILLMNCAAPLIDRGIALRRFGAAAKKRREAA